METVTPPALIFFFKFVLAILGISLHLHMYFKISFVSSCKKTKNSNNWDFDRDYIESVHQVVEYCHLNDIKFPDPMIWIFSHLFRISLISFNNHL